MQFSAEAVEFSGAAEEFYCSLRGKNAEQPVRKRLFKSTPRVSARENLTGNGCSAGTF
jgi:hypothetical protein